MLNIMFQFDKCRYGWATLSVAKYGFNVILKEKHTQTHTHKNPREAKINDEAVVLPIHVCY